jgi:hypothetical protein
VVLVFVVLKGDIRLTSPAVERWTLEADVHCASFLGESFS